MRRFTVGFCSLLLAALACVASVRTATAVSWYDDFNDGSVTDGSPFTWEQNLFGFFPGNYTVTAGDYTLSNPGNTDNDQQVTWNDGPVFTDLYMRTQGIVLPGSAPNETGGNLALLGRLDPNSVSSYILYIDAGGGLGLQISLGGGVTDLLPSVTLPINAQSEIILELDIIGNQLNGYAWQPGTKRPSVPQISFVDSTIPAGKAGIAYDEDDDNTTGVYRFVAAQSTPFATCDFNLDSLCNITDLDALAMDAAAGLNTPVFDLTGDNLVNVADADAWRSSAGELNIGAGRSYRVGDANLDGVVDGTDFGIWNSNKFTTTGKWSQGDFNVDGVSDGSDFNLWNANKFTSSDGSLVPEPMVGGMALASLLVMAAGRRR